MAHQTIRASALPAHGNTEWVYSRTDAGRRLLNAPRAALGPRERQILLLCTGERDAAALTHIFGPATPVDLARLQDQGLVQVVARDEVHKLMASFSPTLPPPEACAPVAPPFQLTMPPLVDAVSHSANQSGFLSSDLSAAERSALRSAQGRVLLMLADLGGAEAEALAQSGQQAWQVDDLLALVAQAIAMAERAGGTQTACTEAGRIMQSLPRPMIGSLLDCMIDIISPAAVAQLYEQWLADSEFTDDGRAPRG